MNKPSRRQALIRAANYRFEVRLFSIDPSGETFEATFYDRDPIAGEIVWGDFEPSATLREVLVELIGEESASRGQRDARTLEARERCLSQRLEDLR